MGSMCKKLFSNHQTHQLEGQEQLLKQGLDTPGNLKLQAQNIKAYQKMKTHDFRVISQIGRGSFGRVYFVQNKITKNYHAMKVLPKPRSRKGDKQIIIERFILESMKNPFILNLDYAFQDNINLYLITEFAQGGDLFTHLKREGKINEERAKFYICEIILALEYLHGHGIIYRDLKPENILLFSDGHVKLIDFGLSTKLSPDSKSFTVCGSREYLAPEILHIMKYEKSLKNTIERDYDEEDYKKDLYEHVEGYGKEVDWWALGCLFFQMLVGKPPFINFEIFNQSDADNVINQQSYLLNTALPLIRDLLIVDPSKRLGTGVNGTAMVKNHYYFNKAKWDFMYNKKVTPSFKPLLRHPEDLSHFELIENTPLEENISFQFANENNLAKKYENYTFVDPTLLIDDLTSESQSEK